MIDCLAEDRPDDRAEQGAYHQPGGQCPPRDAEIRRDRLDENCESKVQHHAAVERETQYRGNHHPPSAAKNAGRQQRRGPFPLLHHTLILWTKIMADHLLSSDCPSHRTRSVFFRAGTRGDFSVIAKDLPPAHTWDTGAETGRW
jgi:hypothetical protein